MHLSQEGSIPLHWLTSEARPSAVQALLDGGSNIEALDKVRNIILTYFHPYNIIELSEYICKINHNHKFYFIFCRAV